MKTPWPTIQLKEIAVARGGSVNPANFPDEDFELYSIPAYDALSPEITKGANIGSSKKKVKTNDVLISRIVPHIQRVWVVDRKRDLRQIASGEWIVFRSDDYDPNFLKHFLLTKKFHLQFMQTVSGVGGSLLRARPEQVYEIEAPLPPLPEQNRIAGILDKANIIRQKRQSAIKLVQEFLRATFLDMFGDLESKDWNMVPVEDVARNERGAIRTGPFGSQLLHSEFVEEGVTVLGIDNVVENEFRAGKPRFITPQKYEELKRYTVKSGDVLISIMGTCGRCAIVPEGIETAINTKHLCCITLDHNKCLPSFMHSYFLLHPSAREYLERNAKGAIMSGLNMGIIKALPIPIPPIDLQQRFDSIVESTKEQIRRLYRQVGEIDTMVSSLQQRAFRGEL